MLFWISVDWQFKTVLPDNNYVLINFLKKCFSEYQLLARSLLFFMVTFSDLQCSVVLKKDACHFGIQHWERWLKLYFVDVSSQASIVLKILISSDTFIYICLYKIYETFHTCSGICVFCEYPKKNYIFKWKIFLTHVFIINSFYLHFLQFLQLISNKRLKSCGKKNL